MPIEIKGLKELSDLLTDETPRAAKRYLGRCAEPAAQVVIDALEQTVPTGIGILEEQLDWQKKFINGDDDTTMQINVGPLKPAYWGSFQEFGTSTQEGQHWMGRAWESCQDRCLDVFRTELTALLMDLENKKK